MCTCEEAHGQTSVHHLRLQWQDLPPQRIAWRPSRQFQRALQVVVSPPKQDRPYRCTINRRNSLGAAPVLLAAEP